MSKINYNIHINKIHNGAIKYLHNLTPVSYHVSFIITSHSRNVCIGLPETFILRHPYCEFRSPRHNNYVTLEHDNTSVFRACFPKENIKVLVNRMF